MIELNAVRKMILRNMERTDVSVSMGLVHESDMINLKFNLYVRKFDDTRLPQWLNIRIFPSILTSFPISSNVFPFA